MEIQPGYEPEGVTVRTQPLAKVIHPDPARALSGPHRRTTLDTEQRTDLVKPLLQDLYRPGVDTQHAAALRRRPAFGLAVTDIHHAILAELPCGRVGSEVGDIEHLGL